MVEEVRDHGEVFSVPDFWASSKLLANLSEHDSSLFSQVKLYDLDGLLPNVDEKAEASSIFFHIPDLLALPAAINPITNISLAHALKEKEIHSNVEEEPDNDVWLLANGSPPREAGYLSWDDFENQRLPTVQTSYISEAGPLVFDAAIETRDNLLPNGNVDCVIVKSQAYMSSLLALGLGRSSTLYTWNCHKQSFQPVLENVRISGYTVESLNGFVANFFECGNITRSLQNFVERSYSRSSTPGRIALADAVFSLLTTIQSRISVLAESNTSILRLEALFRPVHSILICFQRIVTNIGATRSDESMLSTIFEEIQLLEHRTDSLRDILLEILVRVSQPWLEFVGEWLGLQKETRTSMTKHSEGKSFVRIENKVWIDEHGFEMQQPDYVLNYDKVPSFIDPENARLIFEVGRSLRLLRSHHVDHPLAKANVIASAGSPSLQWRFSWDDIVQLEAKALQYEQDLKATIRHYSETSDSLMESKFDHNVPEFELDFFGKPAADMEAHVIASIDIFEQSLAVKSDNLSIRLSRYLASEGHIADSDIANFDPPIALVPILSFSPFIAAQARIVNGTCMQMILKSHKFREHISVQKAFHLLGNGTFSSRLSHALFDPELESAERYRGIARSGGIMGLRLGGRDNWPPASSELRLALMGVLTESYIPNNNANNTYCSGTYLDQACLPGDISFAVRDMSQEEITACLNADSLEALDFLRLSYKAPPALEAVITPTILYKYDQLFKLLLRCLRMLYTVSSLFRDATGRTSQWHGIDDIAQRFRIESHHFITSICSYFFYTGIESTWRIFDHKLDELEQKLDPNEMTALGPNEGIDKLRDYHEQVLDRIMFSLFMRKRQQPVLHLLEEIFTLILRFSKYSRERALGLESEEGAADELSHLYADYRKKVGVFISVCRGMSEKKGFGERKDLEFRPGSGGIFDGKDLVGENTIVQLLARLEMSGYYDRSPNI